MLFRSSFSRILADATLSFTLGFLLTGSLEISTPDDASCPAYHHLAADFPLGGQQFAFREFPLGKHPDDPVTAHFAAVARALFRFAKNLRSSAGDDRCLAFTLTFGWGHGLSEHNASTKTRTAFGSLISKSANMLDVAMTCSSFRPATYHPPAWNATAEQTSATTLLTPPRDSPPFASTALV